MGVKGLALEVESRRRAVRKAGSEGPGSLEEDLHTCVGECAAWREMAGRRVREDK